MPKAKLTMEHIENIKNSKGYLSASEVQRKYGIGWTRLQKIWDSPVTTVQSTQPHRVTAVRTELAPVRQVQQIIVEDFFERLGQLNAQMERQTELMQNIVVSLDKDDAEAADAESVKDLEVSEAVEEITLQNIRKSLDVFSKTIM